VSRPGRSRRDSGADLKPGRSGRPSRASSGAWPARAPRRPRRSVHLRAAPNGSLEAEECAPSEGPCGPLAACGCACRHGPERAERRTGAATTLTIPARRRRTNVGRWRVRPCGARLLACCGADMEAGSRHSRLLGCV
jgi:hypothetical protein